MSRQKTKTVTLKGWANYYPDQQDPISFGFREDMLRRYAYSEALYKAVPCTITLEVPAPERTVTLTESEFERFVQDYRQPTVTGGAIDFLRSKFFGDGDTK